MSDTVALEQTAQPGKALRYGLWVAQVVAAFLIVNFGFMKLTQPIADLSVMMAWVNAVPEGFVRFMGAVDLLGGLGLLLPSLTRIMPKLTPLAAVGCLAVQVLAVSFHSYRGEFSVLPLNVILIALVSFILWGRSKKAPILPRE